MSWLFSQALVEAYSEGISSDGEQCALSSGNHTQQAYLSPDKMKAFSRLSQYGMTCKPLMADRGEELLTLYLEGFPAKTSASSVKEPASKESAVECGDKWRASFAKYDRDTSSWKTPQCSLLGDSEQSLETWPKWGLMRDGECWEQTTLAPHTKEKESGSLPTPMVSDYKGGRSLEGMKAAGRGERNDLKSYFSYNGNWQYPPVAVLEYMMGWPQGWTGLKPLETDKYQQWQQQHGEYLRDNND